MSSPCAWRDCMYERGHDGPCVRKPPPAPQHPNPMSPSLIETMLSSEPTMFAGGLTAAQLAETIEHTGEPFVTEWPPPNPSRLEEALDSIRPFFPNDTVIACPVCTRTDEHTHDPPGPSGTNLLDGKPHDVSLFWDGSEFHIEIDGKKLEKP